MTNSRRSPAPGIDCFVAMQDGGRNGELGVVVEGRTGPCGTDEVRVEWGRQRESSWHRTSELRSGFRRGHVVQDRPRSNTRNTLGTATVVAGRRIADRDMVLVQLHSTGESRWLPYESLVRVRDAALQYRAAHIQPDAPERFRLKALAYALDSWNQITGALDRLDVDPLPHQIDLVHRIMASDHSNWLIADDVGLGKTIEVGLLLAAMKRRRRARRVLVVCPAGVVRQWQDEMQYKFSEHYFIYGLDFNIRQPAQWAHYDKVIVSVDRAKSEQHWPAFADSGDWDVIVFDEAHHLSKIEGAAVTQRYRLADRLKDRTDSLIFLTGTPHQGKHDQFVNLLMLLRPDLRGRLAALNEDPSVVSEMILRNRKSLVTDAAGEFLFRGQTTTRIHVPLSEAAGQFDSALRRYVKQGYAASTAGGHSGRAIGFVMTTYRKLASSSIVAIERALRRRLARLSNGHGLDTRAMTEAEFDEMAETSREGEDGADDLAEVSDRVAAMGHHRSVFFQDERPMLVELCEMASAVRRDDRKLKAFLTDIVEPLRRDDIKILIFTEYRGTQEYLAETLDVRFPDCGVCQINGGMSLDEKRRNIDEFNDSAAFLVSTEAGGEGINLHANCHVLVNYDLPWNPRRLVQRAGRLYRYGQRERVIVFNLVAKDGFDNRALWTLLDKVSTIAHGMSEVSEDFHDGLETEIVGDLLERVDIGSFLADNREMDIHRSKADIEDAVDRARQSKSQQESLFSHIEGYDPKAAVLHTFGPSEVLAFLEGVLPRRDVGIRNRLYDGRVLELELPDDMRGAYAEFGGRKVVRVTTDRSLALRDRRLVPMDFASTFFSGLIEFAKSPEFGGEYAHIGSPRGGVLGLYKVRWQDDQGIPRWEALVSVFRPSEGGPLEVDPEFFGSLLVRGQRDDGDAVGDANIERRNETLSEINRRANEELASRCTPLRHPNDIVMLAAADMVTECVTTSPERALSAS